MAFIFLPSLQHIAAVKVALSVYNDDINHFFEEFLGIDDVYLDFSFHISKRQRGRIINRKKEIRKELTTLIPESLVDGVVHILEPIVTEVHFWIRDHFYIFKHIEKSHNTDSLCWKSEGTIDRTKTAKQLIQNESIDKRVRFVLACIYFLEHDVVKLWQGMEAEERQNISDIDSNLAVGFWMEWLKKKNVVPWKEWIPKYLTFDSIEPILNYDSRQKTRRIRLSSFYGVLNKYMKFFLLQCVWPRHAHIDDLRVCYYLTDDNERASIFYMKPIIKHMLCFYLDWPLQSRFLDMVTHMWKHIKETCDYFEHFVYYLVDEKMSYSMEDFNYLQLLKDFWKRIPEFHKREIESTRGFFYIRLLLRYNGKPNPLPIEKILSAYRILNELDFNDFYFKSVYIYW